MSGLNYIYQHFCRGLNSFQSYEEINLSLAAFQSFLTELTINNNLGEWFEHKNKVTRCLAILKNDLLFENGNMKVKWLPKFGCALCTIASNNVMALKLLFLKDWVEVIHKNVIDGLVEKSFQSSSYNDVSLIGVFDIAQTDKFWDAFEKSFARRMSSKSLTQCGPQLVHMLAEEVRLLVLDVQSLSYSSGMYGNINVDQTIQGYKLINTCPELSVSYSMFGSARRRNCGNLCVV
jgi:hypothetical protein